MSDVVAGAARRLERRMLHLAIISAVTMAGVLVGIVLAVIAILASG